MQRMEALSAHVPRLAEASVLCAGDVMLDQFIYGSVERISPEAPIPVLRVTRETSTLGGLGNVARNLAALGASCEVHSVVGDDGTGTQIRGLLGQLSRCRPELETEAARQTSLKTRCIAGSQQLVRVDRESQSDIARATAETLLGRIQARLPACDVLVLSDYGKGVLTREVTTELIAAARRARRPVIVDPKGADYTRYRSATIVTPNRQELSLATGISARNDDSIVAAARRLIETCDFEAVLATRSEQGMTLVTRDGRIEHLAAEAREVFDVSGAGDTVVAAMAAGMSIELPLLDAAQLANTAAGIVVGKVGTAAVRAEELLAALRQQSRPMGAAKIADFSTIPEAVEAWRRAGLQVGFTNGCFDLLHPGHISLLAQAASRCDRLIVGLNSDASVRRLKGPERPVQHEHARATVLSCLECVAAVVIFDEETPQRLIETVRPDVLVKGADYKIENVVGADFVQSYGGQVYLAELVPEQSTTRLVTRLRHGKAA